MKRTNTPFYVRRTFILTLISLVVVATGVSFGVSARRANRAAALRLINSKATAQPVTKAQDKNPNAPDAAAITATLTDNTAVPVAPGGTINYTAVISNAGAASPADDALSAVYNATLDANTTLSGLVGVSPVPLNDTYPQTVIGNVQVNSANIPYSVVTNDYQGQNGGALTAATSGTTANGGQVVMTTTGPDIGKFTYNPPAGFEGNDTFTYTLTNSVGSTTAATVTIPVAGMVWFINNNSAVCTTIAAGCGRITNPFSDLGSFNTVNNGGVGSTNPAVSDNIFIYESATAYNNGVTLLNGQRLIGQDSTSTLASLTGLTPPSGSTPFPAMNSGNGTITKITTGAGNGITLNSAAGSNLVNGLTVGNTAGVGIFGTNFGAVTIADVSIDEPAATRTGQALSLTTGVVTATFGTVESSTGTNNVNLVSVTGNVNLGTGALSGATGSALTMSGAGNTATVSYAGTITNTTASAVSIANKTGGTVTLSGLITGSGSGVNGGISLLTNTGTVMNFTGGVALNMSGAAPGFTATGGGTVSVTDPNAVGTAPDNTIVTVTGIALNVANTTIGAGDLNFRSISSGAAPNGIVLNNTGTAAGNGGLTVTGNGGTCTVATPTCTGGTLQNTTGTAVLLTSTRDVSFTRFRILDPGGEGLVGTGVINFTFADGLNIGAGDADNEDGFDFGALASTNITGTLSITNSVVRQFTNDGLVVRNTTGALAITLTNNTFFNNDGTAFGVNAVLVEGFGTAGITLNATGNTFDQIEGESIQYEAEGSGTNDINIIGNTMTHPSSITNFEIGGGITIIPDQGVLVTFDIQGNYFNNIADDAIVIVGEGDAEGRIGGDIAANQVGPGGANQGNTIKQSGSQNGCAGDGIRLDFDGTFNAVYNGNDTWEVLIKQNYIDQHNGVDVGGDLCPGFSGDQGIVIFNRDHVGNLHITVDSNTVIDSLNQGLRSFTADRDGATTGNPDNGPNTFHSITNNSFTNINGVEAISISVDDLSDTCANITGNTKSGGGAPDGTIFLDRRVAGTTFTVPQASTAAISAANNGATVTLGPQPLTFNTACNPTLPTNAFADQADDFNNNVARPEADEASALHTPSSVTNSGLAVWPVGTFKTQTEEEEAPAATRGTQIYPVSIPSSPAVTPAPGTEDGPVALGSAPSRTRPVSQSPLKASRAVSADALNVDGARRSHHARFNRVAAIKAVKSDDPIVPTSGEAIGPINIGTLPAGKSVTITYAATVNTPPTARQATHQGTVTYTNGPGSPLVTNDPDTGPANDATVTLFDVLMTWNGVTSTDWNTASNWTQPAGGTPYAPGVSNPAINDVVIPNVGNQPNISATDIGIYSLNIANGRTLTITNPRTLTIGGSPGGNLTLDGIISGGNLNLGTGTHAFNVGASGSLSSTNVATVLSGSTVTLNNNLQAGALAVNAGGSMNVTNRTLSLNGSGAALTVPGGATFTTTGSTVIFNGTAAQQAAGIAYNNLTINNTIGTFVTGVTLTGNATVNGALALTSSDLNTGAFTLTQPNTTPSTGVSDVVGTIARTGGPFALATPLTFGNPNNIITFTAGASRPTTMTVTMAKAPPATYAVAVARNYTITPTGGAGYTATLRLHYRDAELNGNDETSIPNFNLRRGPSWNAVIPTARNTAGADDNWLENNAVTQFSQWTFANLAPTASGGTVTGRIVDDNGAPVEGAVVRLSGAQNRKFITDANGVYRFDNVETGGFYNVTPSRVNYNFSPAVISFSQLGETTEAAFGATATGGSTNPLDTPEYFVRQNYLDFLGREPDESGFNFWSDQILACGGDTECVDRKRTHVSAAYFLSIEFQQTGGLVDSLYRASFGRRPSYGEFQPGAAAVAPLLVVGADGWATVLENGKAAFVDAFVQRAAFQNAYGSLSSGAYVDALIANTGVSFTSAERNALVSGLSGGMTRAQVLRAIVEDADVVAAKRNDAFVMMEYFGYFRREPDAAGFDYWLNKLNQFNGNFEQAEMVRAFIVSTEYRQRFPK